MTEKHSSKVTMAIKIELVKEYDRLEQELAEVDKHFNDLLSLTVTKESLQEYNQLVNRKNQIEKRISEIITEIAQLIKENEGNET